MSYSLNNNIKMDTNTDMEIDTENINNSDINKTVEPREKIIFVIRLLNDNTLYNKSEFSINGKFLWNYIMTLCKNLVHKRNFYGYFNKTMNTFLQFKNMQLNNSEKVDYFRRCLFLSNLQYIMLIKNDIQLLNKTCIIKITPSKNNKKSCSLIDDSSIIDENNKVIGETNGSENEPHRGHKLFNSFLPNNKQLFIN